MQNNPNFSSKKVVIVHDWLVGGGAELVVEQLHKIYPQAPIYTSYATEQWRKRLDGKVVTGYLGWKIFGKLRKFLPVLRILWFQSLDLRSYDIIISSSGAEAKGVKRLRKDAIHINYCHAPTHYYWRRYTEYMDNPGFGKFNFLARFGLKLLVSKLRQWDYAVAQKPNIMIANSTYIAKEIRKYYGRDAEVIFPPVDIEKFKTVGSQPRNGFIVTGRQTHYKRIDLAVQACSKLEVNLTVVGAGPEHEYLKKIAGPSVSFAGFVADEKIAQLLSEAKGFIFAGADDFGIAPVEAIAAGVPVIAYKDGGALDYVIEGKTGVFFDTQTSESLEQAIARFEKMSFGSKAIQAHAANFSQEVFRAKITTLVSERIEP